MLRVGGHERAVVGVLDQQPSAGPDGERHGVEGSGRIGQMAE
jgi:hypothetical protein